MPSRTAQAENPAGASALSRIGQRRQVVIPRKVFDALALAEGDFMEVTVENGHVAMKPRKSLDARYDLTAADAKKLRHAMQQIKAGKTKPWSQVKHGLDL
jgi:AbrB family looped-hinge helix DNA binding protein